MDETPLTAQQAVTLWKRLEEQRDDEYAGDPPTYAVRLDAVAEVDGDHVVRSYRVRVIAPKRSWFVRDSMLYVLEVAGEVAPNAPVTVENDGIVIG